MPTLDWIGKKAVVNHHRDVPYCLIHRGKEKPAERSRITKMLKTTWRWLCEPVCNAND